MLPEHYEPRHHAQQLGFKGPDLAKKHHHAVLTSARAIPLELIRSVNGTQFHINLQSNLGRCYLVDIQRLICNCPDFPRVQICKHLCAVKIWYPFIPPADDLAQDLQRSSSISYQLAATSTSLSEKGELPPVASISISTVTLGALPDWDRLSPNQNLWAATAKKMGVRAPPKRCQQKPVTAAIPSSTSQHIGPVNVKCKLLFTDAYPTMEGSNQVSVQRQMQSLGLQMHLHTVWPLHIKISIVQYIIHLLPICLLDMIRDSINTL